MHEVLVNRLGGLSLPRKSVVRLTDRPDTTLDVYRGRKTTMQQQQQCTSFLHEFVCLSRSSMWCAFLLNKFWIVRFFGSKEPLVCYKICHGIDMLLVFWVLKFEVDSGVVVLSYISWDDFAWLVAFPRELVCRFGFKRNRHMAWEWRHTDVDAT